MHELHVAAGGFFAGELIGYTAEVLIAAGLLALTLRAVRLPGASRANVIFAGCAALWSVGGLAHLTFSVAGVPGGLLVARTAAAAQYIGAAFFPIAILAAWRPYALRAGHQKTLRILESAGLVAATAISCALLYESFTGSGGSLILSQHLTSVNATVLLCCGAAVSLRRASTPRAVFVPSLLILIAVTGAALLIPLAVHRSLGGIGAMLPGIGNQTLVIVLLCAFFLFARFRHADIFVRYSVRILLAAGLAAVLALAAQMVIMSQLSGGAMMSPAFHVLAITVVSGGLMLAFAFVDAPVSRLVNRWLFHSPDYRMLSRQLGETLRGLDTEAAIAGVVENDTRQQMSLEKVRLVPLGALPQNLPDDLMSGDIAELAPSDPLRSSLPAPNVEFLVPVDSAGQLTHVLLVSPGPDRPALVTADLNYLRTVAAHCGNRLNALGRERENVERRSREAVLLQQVTEAELRALRSQVNPHFLFNSLNTIADLIVSDPPRAEEMTLRLAELFRHVLAHSTRPLTPVRDEIEFVRAYLYIEEARFRDRLHVEIDVDAETADEEIPSLILQPLVENALRHGLAPKPGPVRLWVSARFDAGRLRLRVEDDGMGMSGNARAGAQQQGVGLRNTAERLRVLYGDRASIQIEPREPAGTRVTMLIPRGESGSAP